MSGFYQELKFGLIILFPLTNISRLNWEVAQITNNAGSLDEFLEGLVSNNMQDETETQAQFLEWLKTQPGDENLVIE